MLGVVGAEVGDDFRCCRSSEFGLVRRKADGADAGVSPAAVALAYRSEIDHGGGVDFRPGIGANGDLGTETRLRQADGIDGLRMQVVGDELVEALEGMIRDVEVYGAVDALGAFADEREGGLMALEQRRQQIGHERLLQDVAQGHRSESGMSRGMKSGSSVDSMMRVSFMAGSAISTAASGLS